MSNEQRVYQNDEEWKTFEQKSIPSSKFLIRYPDCPVIPPDFRAGTYLEYLFMDISSVCFASKDESEKKELLFVSELIRSAALYVPLESVIFVLFSTLKGQGISLEIFSSASEMESLAEAYGVSGLIKFLKGFYLRLRNHRHFNDCDFCWQDFNQFRLAQSESQGVAVPATQLELKKSMLAKNHMFQRVLELSGPRPKFGSREAKRLAGVIPKRVVSAYERSDFITKVFAWKGFVCAESCANPVLAAELIKVSTLLLSASVYLDHYEFDRCIQLSYMFAITKTEVLEISKSIKELEGCDLDALRELCGISVLLDFVIHHHRFEERDEP